MHDPDHFFKGSFRQIRYNESLQIETSFYCISVPSRRASNYLSWKMKKWDRNENSLEPKITLCSFTNIYERSGIHLDILGTYNQSERS